MSGDARQPERLRSPNLRVRLARIHVPPPLPTIIQECVSHILCATHGGASADGACRVAALLAARSGARLSVLCVIEPIRMLDGGFAPMYVPTPEEDEAVRSSARGGVREQLRRCGVSATVHVRTGPPVSEIANIGRESAADAIVVGLGRHQFLDRALGNETALQLAQLAATPVLAVPATMTALPRRVLAAIDFSPTSIGSIRAYARWLAKGDILHLVHVSGEWPGGYPLTHRVTAENVLSAAVHQIDPPGGVVIEQGVVEGEPAVKLLEIAAATNADVIVLGSHGYGFWKRLTIGSVASKIIRLSQIAVYVTPIGCLATTGVTRVTPVAKSATV
jgi:nucleotide-binding universal stress UspA family protein